MDEHDILTRFLRPLAAGFRPARGLLDDTAVLNEAGPVAISTDTLVEGVHFPGDILPPDDIARRALRVNLSDLAAAGAEPYCYFLSLQLPPPISPNWLEAFATGLRHDQEEFGLSLAGGDTVRTPGPLAITITALGRPSEPDALMRSAAKPGDKLLLTGTIGDAHLGRLQLEGHLPEATRSPFLSERFRLPTPRIMTGRKLAQLAHAAIDISDGLIGDLDKLCSAAGVGARISQDKVPLSAAARDCLAGGVTTWPDLVTGGDDYELLFSVPSRAISKAIEIASSCGVPTAVIGEITEMQAIVVLGPDGPSLGKRPTGYRHAWGVSTQ